MCFGFFGAVEHGIHFILQYCPQPTYYILVVCVGVMDYAGLPEQQLGESYTDDLAPRAKLNRNLQLKP